jgi:hypothetical protein
LLLPREIDLKRVVEVAVHPVLDRLVDVIAHKVASVLKYVAYVIKKSHANMI